MTALPDFAIKHLGKCTIDSPIDCGVVAQQGSVQFIDDSEKVVYDSLVSELVGRNLSISDLPGMELAGPRKKIYFDPSKTRAAMVTCGGLCPGLNNVIRGLTLALHFLYDVKKVYGFQYGYEGFIAKYGHEVIALTPDLVDSIHERGGTILSSSRGDQSVSEIVDCLDRMDINILFTIGGDGTMRGTLDIVNEIERRELNISVVSIPKTIDNDINFTEVSFGFQTAYSEAVHAISSAHIEAKGAPNGVGLVRLMGRYSGFIACYATLAMPDVNFVLIPEVPFELEGPNGLYETLRKRLTRRGHAVIVVAEGAGQNLISGDNIGKDASGNVKLKNIGIFLRDSITNWFKEKSIALNMKYIDPSYTIRSVPAYAVDSVFCNQLSRNAVHASMAGKTGLLIGNWHNQFVHVPIKTAISMRKTVDPHSELWRSVLETTGQPLMVN